MAIDVAHAFMRTLSMRILPWYYMPIPTPGIGIQRMRTLDFFAQLCQVLRPPKINYVTLNQDAGQIGLTLVLEFEVCGEGTFYLS
jgi:hypothetical protein